MTGPDDGAGGVGLPPLPRPHDMGGRTGDGPVVPAPGGPDGISTAEAPWQERALAVTLAAGATGAWNIDESRAAREDLPDYAGLGYYEKWLAALADLLVAKGLVEPAELTAGDALPAPLSARALRADRVAAVLAAGSPYARPARGPAPLFAPGDRVRTRARPANAFAPGRHTRLPLYAAGKTGRVVLAHGPHVFPDHNSLGLGEAPEPLYTVVFRAADLWPDAESPDDEVTVDLWQSYLAPA